MHASVTF